MSKYQKEILEIVNGQDGHLTAEEVYLQLKKKEPKVVLATVYNNLNILHEKGQIGKVTVAGLADRYDRSVRHDHLICKKCGKIKDVFLPNYQRMFQNDICDEVINYDLKLYYLCDDCKKGSNI